VKKTVCAIITVVILLFFCDLYRFSIGKLDVVGDKLYTLIFDVQELIAIFALYLAWDKALAFLSGFKAVILFTTLLIIQTLLLNAGIELFDWHCPIFPKLVFSYFIND